MSTEIDLCVAVEAAALATHLEWAHSGRAEFCHAGPAEQDWWRAGLAVRAAAPLIEAQVRAQVAAKMTALVQALQAMCDDEWLRRRDRIMRLTGTRYLRRDGAGEIEYAAHMVRSLIGDLPGYDPVATSGAYLDWMRGGRDEGMDAKDATS